MCIVKTKETPKLPQRRGGKLSLRDAIAITLVNNPQIQLQDYVIEQVTGAEQQADGQFDINVVGNMTYGRIFTPEYDVKDILENRDCECNRAAALSANFHQFQDKYFPVITKLSRGCRNGSIPSATVPTRFRQQGAQLVMHL